MAVEALPAPPFVGRETERAAYQQALREERGPWLLNIFGPGGNGKSGLLRQCRAETPDAFRVGLLYFANDRLRVDTLRVLEEVGAALRPMVDVASFQQFEQACERGRERLSQFSISLQQQITIGAEARAEGFTQSINIASAVNEMRRHAQEQMSAALLRLAGAARGRRLVLLLDTCEWFNEPGSQEVGDWLVSDLLQRLRERLEGGLRVVAAGREPLRAPQLAGEIRPLPLGLLPFPALESYLGQIGMQDAALRRAVFDMTRGHPLCLTIVADLWREHPFGSAELPAFQGQFSDRAVMQWVQERVLDKRMQPPYDDLARYGVLLRSFDLPLLRQVFPDWLDAGDLVFQRLIRYSFVIRLTDGRYAFHDLLRQVQAGYLRQQLPERWQQYHARALRAWEQRPEQVFGRQVAALDYYYHRLALDEQEAGAAWDSDAWQVAILGERDYWGRFLQAAHDAALAPGAALAAARAFHQGRFFYYQARWDDALRQYHQALTLFQQVGDRLGEANTRQAIGDVQQFQADYAAALDSYQQALTLFQQVGDRLGEANTRKAIGDVQQFQADYAAALDSYQQALTLFQQVGDRLGEANCYLAQGGVARAQGAFQKALELHSQGYQLFQLIQDRLGEANCYLAQGGVARAQGAFQKALELHSQGYQLFQLIQDSYSQSRALYELSFDYEAMGEQRLAIQHTEMALQIAQRLRLPQVAGLRQRLDDLRGKAR